MKKFDTKTNSWLLILGQIFAQLSDRMLSIGLVWTITENFGEKLVTWYLVAGGIPHILFFAFSAKLISKIGALKTVVISDLSRAALFLLGAWVITSLSSHRDLALVIALIILTNVFAAFFNPAILTLPLQLETETGVQILTAKLTTVSSSISVVGPVFGLMLFEKLGIQGLMAVAAVSYLFSGLCAMRIRTFTPPTAEEENKGPKGISIMGRYPLVLTMLFIFLCMNFTTGPIQVLMPFFAKHVFVGSFNYLAWMEATLGAGIVFGGIILSIKPISKRILFYIWIFLMAASLGYAIFTMSAQMQMAIAGLLVLGNFVGLANILIVNFLQSHPKVEHVPTVMSLVNLIGVASIPVSLTVFGFMQSKFDTVILGRVLAILLILICVASIIPFRKLGKEHF